METDSKNHRYVDVGNVRVTYIPSWHGSRDGVIQMATYQPNGRLLPGPQFPISGAAGFVRLIVRLCAVYDWDTGNDIVRALFTAAINAQTDLEKRLLQQAGKPWTAAEDQELREEFDKGLSVPKLAEYHTRTSEAIKFRLKKLGKRA